MDTIWDLVQSQPITNRLYEMNKAVEEAAAIENRVVKTTATQIPVVPIEEIAKTEDPAYSVSLSKQFVGAYKPSEQALMAEELSIKETETE